MDDDIHTLEELERKKAETPKWIWFVFILGIIATPVAFLSWGLWPAAIVFLIALAILFQSTALKGFRRIFYLTFVLFAVMVIVIVPTLNWLLTFLAEERLLEGTRLEFLTDNPGTWAWLIGLSVGGLTPIIIKEIYIFLNVEQIVSFTGFSRGDARRILSSMWFNFNRPYILIKDGEKKDMRPKGVLHWMGPGLAIITPGHAVVFERGGELTRIAFAGVALIEGYESARKIIDLHPQFSKPVVENVITRDGVLLSIQLKIFYEILRTGQPSLANPYPVDRETIFKAACAVGDWKGAAPAIASDILRDVIAEHDLDDFIQYGVEADKPIFRKALKDEVRKRVNEITLGYFGVNITWVDIGEIEMPEEARERLLAGWLADQDAELAEKQKLAAIVRSESEAESLSTIGLARAKAQRQMILAITDAFHRTPEANVPWTLVMLRFVEALENMAKDPSTKLLFPYSLPFEKLEAIKSALERDSGEGSALPPPP